MNSIYSLLGIVVYGAIFAMVMCHVIRRQVEERELERQEERNNAVSDLKADEEIYPRLTHVRVLEEFEGPILSELRGDDGTVYIEKLCAFHEGAIRSIVVRSDQCSIAEYLARRITMMDLITKPNDDIGFIFDRVGKTVRSVQLVRVSALPTEYLPDPMAKHDESLRPRAP